ncbi:MAG: hypothetical protein QW835_06295 [Candidatus Hadarchaeum sp.]
MDRIGRKIEKFISQNKKENETFKFGDSKIVIVRMRQKYLIEYFSFMFNKKVLTLGTFGISISENFGSSFENFWSALGSCSFIISTADENYLQALKFLLMHEKICCTLYVIDSHFRKKTKVDEIVNAPRSYSLKDLYLLKDKIILFESLKFHSSCGGISFCEFREQVKKIDFDFKFEEISLYGEKFSLPILFIGFVCFGFCNNEVVVKILFSYLVESGRLGDFRVSLMKRLVEIF